MGFEHILSGYDHLAFLLGLALGARRIRSLITTVTAFTLAHSLTLSCAALGWFALPSWLVEPAIALSVAYVGAENLLVRGAKQRYRLTFLFGLIHGFGFASALREVELPRKALPFALGAFNLGVEFGQLALLAAALPLVFWLRRYEFCARRALPGLSLVVAAAGLVWFVARVTG
jgi:hydrogenase/urease accessory protein HupE